VRLIDVNQGPAGHAVLWQLLSERTPEVNISHKAMPTWEQHVAFVASKPYAHWYMVDAGEDDFVGAVYLTHQREIGVGILKRYQGRQYGPMAVRLLMERHPGRFLANVSPRNFRSQELFREMGFQILQFTYELKA
jgi:RimJ/RimL family protein N-acetyltransferase